MLNYVLLYLQLKKEISELKNKLNSTEKLNVGLQQTLINTKNHLSQSGPMEEINPPPVIIKNGMEPKIDGVSQMHISKLNICLLKTFVTFVYFSILFQQDDYVFPNGVKIANTKMNLVNDIPKGPNYDRDFINKIFTVVYSEKYLNKQVTKGSGRDRILAQLRETKRHLAIKGDMIVSIKIYFA